MKTYKITIEKGNGYPKEIKGTLKQLELCK